MTEEQSSGVDTELAGARKSMGFESRPIEEGSLEGKPDEKPETSEELEASDESKESEQESEEDESEDTEEETDEEEDEDEDEDETLDLRNRPSKSKPSRIERTLFKQMGELNKKIDSLISKPTEEKKDDLEEMSKKLSEELNEDDPEAIKKLVKVFDKLVADHVGKLDKSKELEELKEKVDELRKKASSIDDYDAEREVRQQKTEFNSEWEDLIPSIKQRYPNAGDAELKQAREEMDAIAHSPKGGILVTKDGKKAVQGYPLSYILFENSKTFDTILKVAPKMKSGETSKGEEQSDTGEKPLLRQDRINASQVKKYEEQNKRNSDDDGIDRLSF